MGRTGERTKKRKKIGGKKKMNLRAILRTGMEKIGVIRPTQGPLSSNGQKLRVALDQLGFRDVVIRECGGEVKLVGGNLKGSGFFTGRGRRTILLMGAEAQAMLNDMQPVSGN